MNPNEPITKPEIITDAVPLQTTETITDPVQVAPAEVTPVSQVVTSRVSHKKLFGKFSLPVIIAAVVVLLVGGSAAAYFGVVVPNKPENIWKTAMNQTSTAYDSAVMKSKAMLSSKGTAINGTYKVEGDFVTDGTFSSKSYDKQATFNADIGLGTTRATVEGRVFQPDTSSNPDIYLKVSGVQGLDGLLGSGYSAIIDGLNNQWVAIDHTLLDNLASESLSGGSNNTPKLNSISSDDVVAIETVIGGVNKQYVFTTDSEKAVLNVAQNVGKETQDGRSVYHYKVGVNKQHMKDYLNALVDALQSSSLNKVLTDTKLRDALDVDLLLKSVNSIDDNYTVDVYVDMGTKLIRTIKITDPKDAASYFEVKVPYEGDATIPLSIRFTSRTAGSSSSPLVTLSLDVKADTAKNSLNANLTANIPAQSTSAKDTKVSVQLTETTNDTPLNVEKPADAKSLSEIIGLAMTGVYGNSSSSTTSLFDSSLGVGDSTF